MKIFISICCLLVITFKASSLFGTKSFGADFVNTSNIRGSARAVAMGEAFVAVADDPSTIFYNPAGLAFTKRAYLSMHFDYLPQNNYTSYISLTQNPREESKWAFGTAITGSFNPGIKRYNTSGSLLESKLIYNSSLIISIARMLDEKENFSIGFNIKGIHRSIEENISYGAGIDLGFKGRVPFIDFGVFISDIVTFEKFSKIDKIVYYDRILKIGIASNFSESFTMALQIDKNLSTDDEVIFRIGSYIKLWGENKKNTRNKKNNLDLEKNINIQDTSFNNAVYLNLGYGNKQIGAGLTITIWKLGFDISASFSELNIEDSSVLFTLNIPLY